MKKNEAEEAIRHLAGEWASETGYRRRPGYYPSFSQFTDWLSAKRYDHYLNFRSSVGARHHAEMWFEAALKDWPITGETQ